MIKELTGSIEICFPAEMATIASVKQFDLALLN